MILIMNLLIKNCSNKYTNIESIDKHEDNIDNQRKH